MRMCVGAWQERNACGTNIPGRARAVKSTASALHSASNTVSRDGHSMNDVPSICDTALHNKQQGGMPHAHALAEAANVHRRCLPCSSAYNA